MHTEPLFVSKSSLYVVATPIGNLQDMTPRAIDILRGVDVIAAEDTRVTGQLLKYFGITTPMISLREHNERAMAEKLVQRLHAGEAIAQVSDAGTPAISDPGAQLVAAVHAAGLRVVPVPGASALTTALSGAGFTCPHTLFYGFLPPKSRQRQDAIAPLTGLPYATVFYEAPHRILDTLKDLADGFGHDRIALIARELTKTFETLRRAPLGELLPWAEADSNQQRGEFVIVIDAAPPAAPDETNAHDHVLQPLLAELPLKQAVALAQNITGAPRNALYERALELKKDMQT
ncbi:16S rRNA (cytidine(1402)-2'-O)-methyltransferase [Silvimonas iriomotensis]|uniref:Ribosomal RNA small subunit methyltransferase I n=1 Tax=Silvimonas iriomotensis TaxID=449662 RepID=A0ABQ2P9S5_9NEIS|nr:16S rRNA (cytidine(1402)-2'-O)-methyltransferase [Silvimonas iriomotensis]GGP21629.1 ribosomal RNA small subunit methyltransferase I [Silvimonas iriomotensis]